MPLPSQDLRANRGTWAVPCDRLPQLAHDLLALAGPEPFDPDFRGQQLATTYFDTPAFALRKARRQGRRYLTLRVRRYAPPGDAGKGVFALSAKTEQGKFRTELAPAVARALLREPDVD